MPGNKAQSAIEYVVTYGWMIIAIVAILAVLFYLDVFSPGRWMGSSNAVSGTSTFSFSDFTVLSTGAATLYIKSESPYRVNITAIEMQGKNLTSLNPAAPFQMTPGQTATVKGNSVLRGSSGDNFYGVSIKIYYNVTGGGQHIDSGSMSGRYS